MQKYSSVITIERFLVQNFANYRTMAEISTAKNSLPKSPTEDPNIAKQNYWLKHAKLYFNFKTTSMSNKIEYSIDCLQSAFALKFV